MTLFSFKKYHFKPSYDATNIKVYLEITNKYEMIFLKVIKKETLSIEENRLLPLGIDDIKTYMINGIIYKMREEFNAKTPIEKKLETLFNKVEKEYGQSILDELEEIAIDSIYEAMGYNIEKICFNKNCEKSYFLKYVQSIFFFKVLNHLEKLIFSPELIKEDNDIDEVEEILVKARLKESLPEDIYLELKEALIKNDCPQHLRSYLVYLNSLKLS